MKRIQTYQKGDPEYVIIHKQFHELQDDERAALSEWVQSKDEYDRVRRVLLELHDDDEEWLEPDASIKKNVMRKFVTEEKGGRMVWLNSLLFAPGASITQQPVVRYGLVAAGVIGLAVFFLLPTTPNIDIAQQTDNTPAKMDSETLLANADTVAQQDTLRVFAEARAELPMAPPVMVLDELSESPTENDVPLAPDAGSKAEMAPEPTAKSDMADSYSDLSVVGEQTVVAPIPQAKSNELEKKVSSSMASSAVQQNKTVDKSVSMAEVQRLMDDLYTAR